MALELSLTGLLCLLTIIVPIAYICADRVLAGSEHLGAHPGIHLLTCRVKLHFHCVLLYFMGLLFLPLLATACFNGGVHSLVPRPSPAPVFDRLQYAKTEGEGLVNLTT